MYNRALNFESIQDIIILIVNINNIQHEYCNVNVENSPFFNNYGHLIFVILIYSIQT